MDVKSLSSVARALVAPGKGILAADESMGTIGKRFAKLQIPSTEENRRAYRNLLFTTPGVEAYISGVILFDETIRQAADDGTPFAKLLAGKGIIPGIKVDTGAKELAGFPGEKVTEGLDGLRERLAEYYQLGARFAKWRAVITIGPVEAGRCGPEMPSWACIHANAHALARYAALCQEANLVPIVEPEVLMDGGHDLARCEAVTLETLSTLYRALYEHRLALEGTLLKPNMVLSGKECAVQAGVQEVAAATVRTLRAAVPAAVPGIVFLSGGQTAVRATEHLNAMNQMGSHPWELSFSYGRALQDPPLNIWKGVAANAPAAQTAFFHRAKLNGAARYGKYTSAMESAA